MRFSAASAAMVALLALAGCSRDPVGDRPDYVATASGRLDARVEARFLAAERDGRIEALLVRPGAKVAAGQPLLTISCGDVAAQADAARAQARASDADARLSDEGPRREAVEAGAARAAEAATRRADAADELRRAEGMQASGYVSARRLTQLRASLAEATAKASAADAEYAALKAGSRVDERAAARARAEAATASANALDATFKKCSLRSPIDGSVLKVLRREGEFSGASTGTPLVVVGDLSTMIVRTELIDRDAARVAVGQKAEVWLDGDPKRWHGHVIEAASLMGRRTSRSLDPTDRFDRDVREVLVAFDGPAPPALVGLRVNVGFLK